MNLDTYSFCPGGTGKKIKHCCSDSLPELQKIQNMVRAQQFAACLNFVNSLLEVNPTRACLLASKCDLLYYEKFKNYQEGKTPSNEWDQTIQLFYERYPENPLALAWMSAQAAISNDIPLAMTNLEKCFAHHYPEMNSTGLLAAMNFIFQRMLGNQCYPGALFVLGMRISFLAQLGAQTELNDCRTLQQHLLCDANIPLPLRQTYSLYRVDVDGQVPEMYSEALQYVASLQWSAARDVFESIAAANPADTNALYNAAVLSLFRADNVHAAELFAQLAATIDDYNRKVDFYTLARLLNKDCFGDQMDMYSIQFTVTDPERLHEALLSNNRLLPQELENNQFSGPPPMFVSVLLDQPWLPNWNASLVLDDIPMMVGTVSLWGKRTDREALLEIDDILEIDRPAVMELISESFGQFLAPEPTFIVSGHPSVTLDSFRRHEAYPMDMPPAIALDFQAEYYQDLLNNCWPELPLGALNASLIQTAEKAERKYMADGLIQALEYYLTGLTDIVSFDTLRIKLEIPLREEREYTAEDITSLPPSMFRFFRLDKLSNHELANIYTRYNPYGIDDTIHKIAWEIIRREDLPPDMKMTAWNKLSYTSTGSYNIDHIMSGKQFCAENNLSDAMFDMMELRYCFQKGDYEKLDPMMHQIYQDHKDDQKVVQALVTYYQQLEEIKLYLQKAASEMPASMGMAQMSNMVKNGVNINADPENIKNTSSIWTPDQPNPGKPQGGNGGTSSLWVPD